MLSGSLELLGRFRSYIAERPSPSLRRVDVGHVAEWLRNGLQNRVRRFNSGRGLHSILKRLDHSWSGCLQIIFRGLGTRWGLRRRVVFGRSMETDRHHLIAPNSWLRERSNQNRVHVDPHHVPGRISGARRGNSWAEGSFLDDPPDRILRRGARRHPTDDLVPRRRAAAAYSNSTHEGRGRNS